MGKITSVLLYCMFFVFGYIFHPYINKHVVMPLINESNDQYSLSFCFTPPAGHCADEIAIEISKAKKSVYIQAYGLTSKAIVDEIIQAKKRGLEIKAILDKSNKTAKYSLMPELINNNIKPKIDTVSGIAHNKVIIIDNATVITGSFNFTNSADKRNAENVAFIHDKKSAMQYIDNFNYRYNQSKYLSSK